jgi:hypothetical protein
VAMRLPVEALQPQLGPILEGVLLWAADSKNKFKLKVWAGRCRHSAAVAVYSARQKLLCKCTWAKPAKSSRARGDP